MVYNLRFFLYSVSKFFILHSSFFIFSSYLCPRFKKRQDDKRYLYNPAAYHEQRVYDLRLVWPFAPPAVGHLYQLATLSRDCLLVDDCLLRVLLSGACQPHRLRGQRRAFQPRSTEGHPGVYLAGGVCGDCEFHLPARATALEPRCGGPLSGGCGVFRIYEAVVREKGVKR